MFKNSILTCISVSCHNAYPEHIYGHRLYMRAHIMKSSLESNENFVRLKLHV